MKIIGIVITKDEELHIERCIKSLKGLVDKVVVVDAFSSDKTATVAKNCGAEVFQRKWQSYSNQLNWTIENHTVGFDLVFRIDADEILLNKNFKEVKAELEDAFDKGFKVFNIYRSYKFLGVLLKDSEFYRRKIVRFFSTSHRFSDRLTDEKIIHTDKELSTIDIEVVDDNLKSFESWFLKQLNYAKLESKNYISNGHLSKIQRYFYSLPIFFRAVVYFCYRLFVAQKLRNGFIGFVFALSQSFLYRLIVDFIISEGRITNNHEQASQLIDDIINYSIALSKTPLKRSKKNVLIYQDFSAKNISSFFNIVYSFFPLRLRVVLSACILSFLAFFAFFGFRKLKLFALKNFLFFILKDLFSFSRCLN